MHFLLVLIIVCTACTGKLIRVVCPENCHCDTFGQLRRISCIQKNLISIEADIPRQTDILDLSQNYISNLDEAAFLHVHLDSLKSLNISNNKVSKVHFNAFRGMKKLEQLDLSHNALTYIHSQWFIDMAKIRAVYLHGNNFMSVQYEHDVDIFNSKTLQILNLANTYIAYVNRDMFQKLPALKELDLSNNSLIQLDIRSIASLQSLQALNISGNDISCNRELSAFCKQNGIALYGDKCPRKRTGIGKFEKMIVAPTIPPETIEDGWLYEDTTTADDSHPNSGAGANNCSNTASHENALAIMKRIYAISPILSMASALVIGLLAGIVVGVIISFSCAQTRHLIQADVSAKRRARRRRFSMTLRASLRRLSSLPGLSGHSQSSILYSQNSPIVSYEQYNTETTPITPRKMYVQSDFA